MMAFFSGGGGGLSGRAIDESFDDAVAAYQAAQLTKVLMARLLYLNHFG
ncbi:MAG: hypothetical protein K6B13_08730 [Prevotella sp.]|nr:hypothetical protein [Prevotella sp.]